MNIFSRLKLITIINRYIAPSQIEQRRVNIVKNFEKIIQTPRKIVKLFKCVEHGYS